MYQKQNGFFVIYSESILFFLLCIDFFLKRNKMKWKDVRQVISLTSFLKA